MKISLTAVCVMCLSVLLLWLPSGSEAGTTNCQGVGNDLWEQWRNGTLPKTDAMTDKLLKTKQDCPQLDRSIRNIVDEIKAHQQKEGDASRHVRKAVGIAGSVPGSAPSPKDEIVDKYLEGCVGKTVNAANCDKLRKDFVEILKEDLLILGSSVNRVYLPDIVRMFRRDEVELRIAAADAIGMMGPQDTDVEMLAPLANDPVPDVRQAVSNMLRQGKGTALALLKERTIPMRIGRMPETPADPGKYSMPVAPNSVYLFDSSDASVGRLSYVAKDKSDPGSFFKAKAKKGPFKLEDFREKYRYQFQDEDEATNLVQEAAGKQMENMQPPDPTNVQAYKEYMEKIVSVGARQGSRIYLDSYQPTLFGSPTVYVLEERQIGQRSYPTRYVVLYQEQAFKKPGYRLSWMTVPDETIKTVQAASIAEEKEELVRNKENEVSKQRQQALDDLVKKKDDQQKKQFKKGQADLEKELGF